MLKMEIAGQVITYKSLGELSERLQEALEGVRTRRVGLEQECKLMRMQEKILEGSLSKTKAAKSSIPFKEHPHG